MTIQGAIAELQNLLEVDDVPFYYKGGIEKVIETIQMEIAEQTEPQTEYEKYLDKIRPHDPHKDWCGDEPQTERTCTNCKHNGVISVPKCDECHDMNKHEFIEPQTDCGWK